MISLVAMRCRTSDRTAGGGLSLPVVGWPTFDGTSVRYARACFGDPGGCGRSRFGARRSSLGDRTTTTSPLTGRFVAWVTHDGPRRYELVTPGSDGECRTEQLDPGARCVIVAL